MKKYRHILLDNKTGDRLELADAPDGWESLKFSVLKDIVYFGVFKAISVEFRYVGDGYKFMQLRYLRHGVNADILHRVYEGNRFIVEGKVDLINFLDDRKLKKFKVNLLQSGYIQKFQTREDVKLNLLNNISLDQKPIDPPTLFVGTVRGKTIKFITEYEGTYQELNEPEVYHHIIPFKLKINGNPGTQEADNIGLDDTPQDDLLLKTNSFYINNLNKEQLLNVDYSYRRNVISRATVVPGGSPFHPWIGYIDRFLLIDTINNVADTLAERRVIWNQEEPIPDQNETISGDFDILVPPGFSLMLVCLRINNFDISHAPEFDEYMDQQSMDNSSPFEFERAQIDMNYDGANMDMLVNQDSSIDNTTTPVLLPHELFNSLVQQINGGKFYSEFFGRVDLGYAQDGPGAYVSLTKGDLLRGVAIVDTQIPTSMREAFTSYNAVFNIGLVIKGDTVYVEPKDDLVNNEIVVDIGEVSELLISAAQDFLFNSVLSGFPKAEYEQENGMDEFNTEVQYTNSVVAAKKELDIRSLYRGDGYGIEFARRAAINQTGTQDTRYDDKLFLLDLVKSGTTSQVIRNESFENLSFWSNEGTGLDWVIASDQMNVSLSPGSPLSKAFVQDIVNALPGSFVITYKRTAANIAIGVDAINFRIKIKDSDGNLMYNTPEFISADGQIDVVLPPIVLPQAPARVELTAELNFGSGSCALSVLEFTLTGPSIGELQTRRLEDIDFVSGIFSPETAINLYISAGQNMLRWKKFLNIATVRCENRMYFFQSKDKNAKLEVITSYGTSKDGYNLDLGNSAYFIPEERKCKAPMTLDQLFAILDNPLGIIKYSYEGEQFYDRLFEVEDEIENVLGNWRFLGTRPTPIEVDDGVPQGNFIKWGNGVNDFIKWGNGPEDLILWQ